MTPTMLIAVAGLLLVFGAWRSNLRARDLANTIAIETCRRLSVQFLDGTVAFASMRPVRDAQGRLVLRRSYVFDYTEDGVSRRQGFVVLVGGELEAVGLAADPRRVH